MRCFLLALYLNLRYFNDFIAKGLIVSGHEYDETKPVVHADHWHIFCKRCGAVAATEVHPSKLKERKIGGERKDN